MGTTFDPAKTTFQTVVYRQYTPNWARQLPNEPGDEGIQGPVIHAQVGDTILVHFENLDTVFNRPHSMHFHGVHYSPGSDGAYIPGFSGPGAAVEPGKSFTYKLIAGPDSFGVWPYHDHSPSMDDSLAGGMYGALSILAPGRAAAGPRVRRLPRADARLHDDRRPRVRRQHAGVPREGRRPRPVGRARARRRLPYVPRPRAPLEDAERDLPATRRRSGRRRASSSSGARMRPARGSTTATSRRT